ncbi:MAG: SMC-Scp complex subunit ScpB [bacterium]|nr:SMC-Scp complex subunit ScpB [bacterium]
MTEALLEAILFAAAKPMNLKKLSDLAKEPPEAVEAALGRLAERLVAERSGLRLVRSGKEYQIMTAPEQSEAVRAFLTDETTGELTKPQLETLTVIVYRQPITKAELEQIRGVNCSLILRNLLMRGLVEVEESKQSFGPSYRVTHDFLRFLGITDIRELPDYEKLRGDVHIASVLERKEEEKV